MARFLLAPILVASLLVPGSASAQGPEQVMSFRLPASNGYTLQVKTERGQTLVSLRQANQRVGVTYYVAGSVAGEAINADLGPLGRIDLDFDPSGREIFVSAPSHRGWKCQVRRQLGIFEGTIRFHGENGYATVEADGVPGSIGPSARRRCARRSTISSKAVLALARRQVERVWTIRDATLMSRSPSLGAGNDATLLVVYASDDAAFFSAYRVETPGPQFTIARTAEVTDPRSSFSYPRTLGSALLQPPAPFAGEAVYSAKRGRLSGDLTVEFPGLPPQSLTGPGFEAQMHAVR